MPAEPRNLTVAAVVEDWLAYGLADRSKSTVSKVESLTRDHIVPDLGARKLRFYCNRPWQSAVVRRVLHGPITAACPASFLRLHGDAEIAVADYVAAKPEIRLR